MPLAIRPPPWLSDLPFTWSKLSRIDLSVNIYAIMFANALDLLVPDLAHEFNGLSQGLIATVTHISLDKERDLETCYLLCIPQHSVPHLPRPMSQIWHCAILKYAEYAQLINLLMQRLLPASGDDTPPQCTSATSKPSPQRHPLDSLQPSKASHGMAQAESQALWGRVAWLFRAAMATKFHGFSRFSSERATVLG